MKLSAYLSTNNIKPSAFAAVVGVAPSTISRLLNGERSPRLELVLRIRDCTGGLVQPDDFIEPEAVE